MAIPNDHPLIRRGRSKFCGLVTGMICAAWVWISIPMEVTPTWGQDHPKPSTTVEGDASAGKILFETHCATCHGPKGRGDGLEIAGATVADLSSSTTQRKLNVDLLTTIHEGRPGKVMPSWGYRLSKEQSRDVLAYVRTLRRK